MSWAQLYCHCSRKIYENSSGRKTLWMSNMFWNNSTILSIGRCLYENAHWKMSHRCSECFKTFSLLCQMKRHMKSQQVINLFQCLDCPKSFLQLSELMLPNRSHTGKEPYSCLECLQLFSTFGNQSVTLDVTHLKTSINA